MQNVFQGTGSERRFTRRQKSIMVKRKEEVKLIWG